MRYFDWRRRRRISTSTMATASARLMYWMSSLDKGSGRDYTEPEEVRQASQPEARCELARKEESVDRVQAAVLVAELLAKTDEREPQRFEQGDDFR